MWKMYRGGFFVLCSHSFTDREWEPIFVIKIQGDLLNVLANFKGGIFFLFIKIYHIQAQYIGIIICFYQL